MASLLPGPHGVPAAKVAEEGNKKEQDYARILRRANVEILASVTLRKQPVVTLILVLVRLKIPLCDSFHFTSLF